MVMKNNRTFPQRGRADGGVRQSVLNVTGREAWNKCWINSLNRVFIAVLCHFSVTTQDSNVLFVLKFTRFNKNSRYWMFFPIFFSIWRNIHWFPVRCQRFQHRRFDCVDPNVSPGTYELGRNRISWPRISSTFLYLMYVSFYFFGFVRSSLCSGTNTTWFRSCSVGQHVVLSLQTGLVLFLTLCHTLVFRSDTYNEYTFDCKRFISRLFWRLGCCLDSI